MQTTERLILCNLIFNEDYCRRVLPYLKSEYFNHEGENKTFSLIEQYITKYNRMPTIDTLTIDLENDIDNINEKIYKEATEVIESFSKPEGIDDTWLSDTTEEFCKEKALFGAIRKSFDIIEDKKGRASRGMIPSLLSDALAISFDNHIGHDFLEDSQIRFDYYHSVQNHIPFDIDLLNIITKGGVVPKTLNCLLAPTGVGKSLVMCHMAAHNLFVGKNVLYITLEMSEEKIGERIDANLLDIPLDMLEKISNDNFQRKIDAIKKKTTGKLIVKEYPTACAGSAHFRHLLNELRLKKNFVPDIIYIDYINICMSSRLRLGANVNSYTYIKAIAEELRGLAVEFNLPIITATQTNREGAGTSDFDMTHTSESFGLPMTLDLLIAVFSNEELAQAGQYMFRQLKNRYSDVNLHRKFLVGVDYSKMKLYNIDITAQDKQDQQAIAASTTKFDKSKFQQFS